jgi:hypothetical protein
MTKQISAFLFCFKRELNPYSPLTSIPNPSPSAGELKPFTPPLPSPSARTQNPTDLEGAQPSAGSCFMHAVADCRCCGDDSHRVCCGTRDIEVLTVPESAAGALGPSIVSLNANKSSSSSSSPLGCYQQPSCVCCVCYAAHWPVTQMDA